MTTTKTVLFTRKLDGLTRRAAARLKAHGTRGLSWFLLALMLTQGMGYPLASNVAGRSNARAAAPSKPPAGRAKPAGPAATTRSAQAPSTVNVFGPRRFERADGPPASSVERFTLPPGAGAPFVLTVRNGAADSSGRSSSATVKLNGAEIFRQRDFNQHVETLEKQVELRPDNTLEVRLTSAPGSHVTVTLTAARTQVEPAQLASLRPSRATQGQSLTVELRGANTHWAAGQTRASFGEEVSVGGAAPGQPGPVHVTDSTTAFAELVVSPTAALAPRNVRVTTPAQGGEEESVSLVNAFTVVSTSAPGAASSRVSTPAGEAGRAGFADGAGAQARFNNPTGVAVGADESVYVADAGNHRVRLVRAQTNTDGTASFVVSTLAGNGEAGFADGAAAQAQFNNPQGLAVAPDGSVYVADTDNHRVRRVGTDGSVSTVAGDGTPGFANGAAAQARFNAPRGVAVDNLGNVYVADTGNAAVRRLGTDGAVTTVAGDGTAGDNDSPDARFDGLTGIACDGANVFVYLADAGNHRVRRLDATGAVITLAGAGRGFADGTTAQARFAEPSGIALDGAGKLVVADAINSLVRLVVPQPSAPDSPQAVTTLAGTGERGGADGAGNVARFNTPRGVAVAASSAVYVADTGNNTLRRVLFPPSITGLSPSSARPGQQISILGERFDARAPERNAVRFTRPAQAGGGQTPARVLSATRTALTVEVPPDAGNGPLTVETEGGAATSPVDFELAPLPAPSVSDFNPKRGPVGTTVTITGANLLSDGEDPLVTFQGAAGARLPALVTSAVDGEVRALVPNAAVTGHFDLTNAGGKAVSPSPFTVESEQDFQLTIAPSSATAVQGGTTTYVVSLTSHQSSFSQLASLSAEGLPAGVAAVYEPEQITAGARSTLSVALGSSRLAPGSYPFNVKATAQVEGRELSRTTAATLNVLAAGQTTLSGRVLSTEDQPIMGAIVSLDGRTATTDAAGSFLLSGVLAGQARPLMIDGRTASAPNRTYPIILEPADIVAGRANVVPYIYYLPPIDTQYEVQVVPGQNTNSGNPRVPGLLMTIPAGANLRNRDGSPVARVSITPLAIDRTPTPLPSNVSTNLVYTSQPGGALTDVAIPVVYPNLGGADPGTRVELYAFDHDFVRWYVYGYGRVSADGRAIAPEIDPATGRPYGLRDFSWHFPNAGRNGDPGGPGPDKDKDCSGNTVTKEPVDLSTGMKIEQSSDIAFGGARGGVQLVRVYTSDKSGAPVFGRFGRGTTDNYDVRLTGNWVAGGAGRVRMPYETTGRLYSYAGTEPGGALLFRNTGSAGQVGDVLRRLADGAFEYRSAEGRSMRFDSNGVLTALVDHNGNATTLTYTGGNLTRITDAVGRSVTLGYNSSNFIESATDPLGRVWRYAYDSFGIIGGGFLAAVTDPLGHVTRYSYQSARLTSVTDARGNLVKQVTYDGSGRVVAQTFADGGTKRYAYELSGTTITSATVTDALGRKESLRFNAAGYIVGRADALGQTSSIGRDISTNLPTSNTGACGCLQVTRQFDSRGNPTAATDRAGRTVQVEYEPVNNKVTRVAIDPGRVSTYTYDARGNLLTTTDALGATATFAYDQFGLLTSITDPLGHTSRVEYDAQGNVSAQVDALGNRTTYEFDAIGRPTAVVDPLGRTASFTYDALDRLVTQTDPSGAVARFEYDAEGNRTAVIDPRNQKWSFKYDIKGRLASATDPLGRVTRFAYDAGDQLVRAATPGGRTVSYGYDARGRRTSIVDALGGVVRFGYDSNGRLTTLTDQRGSVSTFVYDELLRLTEMRDPLGRASSIAYDAAGNVASTSDRLGRQTLYAYDLLSRPTRVTYTDASVALSYDAAGRPTRVDDTQGGSIQWSYDAANRVLSEATAAGQVNYTYNAAGERTSMSAGGRPTVDYGYDAVGRLQTIRRGAEVFTYGYDDLSRRTSLQRPNGVKTAYGYDAVGRLSRMTHSNALGAALEDFSYSYTRDDEIESITSFSSATVLSAERMAAAADAANRVRQSGDATYDFDQVGQTVSKTDAAGTTQYSWDGRGRLTQAELPGGQTVSYGYDALGRRASRTAGGLTTQFLHDGPDVVLDREEGGGAVEYLHGAGADEHLRQEGPAGGPLYFLQDHLGSTAALADAGGSLVERRRYEPFGATAGGSLTRYGFTGRERDEATQLLYFRARWYDASQGRFLSEDPAGMAGGLNLYAYAANNPVLYNDPFGLSATTFFQGLGVGMAEGAGGALIVQAAMALIMWAFPVAGAAIIGVALGILAYYGLEALNDEVIALGRIWDNCPDERDFRVGRLIGQFVGAILGGMGISRARAKFGRAAEPEGCPTCKGGESCFVAGTLVKTAEGEKPIEEIRAGDTVLSAEPERADSSVSQPVAHEVTRTFVRTSPVVLDIRAAGETTTATPEHPFWVVGRGWTPAGSLAPGDLLLNRRGQAVRVESVQTRRGQFRVYNFEVAGAHTYYVSRPGLLVHNQCNQTGGGNPPPYERSQYTQLTEAQRQAALAREPTCQYCGQRPSTAVDHIDSLKQDWVNGGWKDPKAVRSARVNHPDNLAGSCTPCNGSKGAKLIGNGPGQWQPPGW